VTGATRRWFGRAALALAGMTGVAGYALAAGQDVNWDSRNYHFYLPWAVLHGRLEFDFVAAGIQTFLNPLVYFPYHLLVLHLPPRAATVGLAALQALSLVPVYLLALHFLPPLPSGSRRGLALLATLTGGTAPLFLTEAGTSFADNLVSLPLLAGVLVACRDLDADRSRAAEKRRPLALLLAGACIGAAAGLKLTSMVYVFGFLVALVVAVPLAEKGRQLIAAICGMIVGGLLTGGGWAWSLWAAYRSPTFPFLNDIFRSPLHPARRSDDPRFLPASFLDALGYPFEWLVGRHPTCEVPFRDARFALIVGLAVALLVAFTVRRLTGRSRPANGAAESARAGVRRGEVFLIVFFFCSGALWLKQFAIQRYIVTLELLSGVLLVVLVARTVGWTRAARWSAGMLLLAVIAWGRPANYGRIPWGESWFGVEPTPAMSAPSTLFISFGHDPVSFVAPFLPKSARHVRLTGDLGVGVPFGQRGAAIVASHAGPIRTLAEGELSPETRDVLAGLGLSVADEECESLSTRAASLLSCPVRRLPVSAQH